MMQQANIVNAIIYIILIFITYKILKFVIPIRRMMKEANRRMQQQAEADRRAKEREGQVRVDYVPPQRKTVSRDEGDYVDFEEVK